MLNLLVLCLLILVNDDKLIHLNTIHNMTLDIIRI